MPKPEVISLRSLELVNSEDGILFNINAMSRLQYRRAGEMF